MKAVRLIVFPLFLLFCCDEIGLLRKTKIDGLDLKFYTFGQSLGSKIGPIFFTSDESGYFTVGLGVCRTDDGGKTWRRLTLQTGAPISDIHFLNEREGYITNDGINCNQISSPTCISKDAAISHTTDGGETWTQATFPIQYIKSIFFNTPTTGFAVGEKVFSTEDSGNSWKEVSINAPFTFFSQVQFANEKMGLMFRSDGRFLRTTDGGKTWEPGPTAQFVSQSPRGRVSVASENLIYFSTEFAIYRSTDWGSTWSEVPGCPTSILSLVGFEDQTIFVVGRGRSAGDSRYHAMLYYSTDGGTTWCGTNKVYEVSTLWGAHFLTSTRGYAYGGTTLVNITR